MKGINSFLLIFVLGIGSVFAASVEPDVIRAKVAIEEMLNKRYSGDLSTVMEPGAFTVSTQVDIREKKVEDIKVPPQPAVPWELSLGNIPFDRLVAQATKDGPSVGAEGFFDQYRISSIRVSAGIDKKLGEDVQKRIQAWLSKRVASEFGSAAKVSVDLIEPKPQPDVLEPPKPTPLPEKNFWDRLTDLQYLASLFVMACASIFALILWKKLVTSDLLEERKTALALNQKFDDLSKPVAPAIEEEPEPVEEIEDIPVQEIQDLAALKVEIQEWTTKIKILSFQIGARMTNTLEAWANKPDESNHMKLAAFFDAISGEEMRFVLPEEVGDRVAEVFPKMAELGWGEKRDTLKRVYWDLLAVRNLGPQVMEKPFGFLGAVGSSSLSSVLVNQNPRLKALVAIHMPSAVRERFLAGLPPSEKRQLVEEVLKLDQISLKEIRTIDSQLKERLGGVATGPTIELKPFVAKLLESLGIVEEIELLMQATQQMSADALSAFKESYPSVAFLPSWGDEPLRKYLSKISPDEVLALVRVHAGAMSRILDLCPPMTSEVVSDDAKKEDRMRPDEKERHLKSATQVLREMIEQGALSAVELAQGQGGGSASSSVNRAA